MKERVVFEDMASEDTKDEITEVNQEKEENTENNDSATSDPKEESTDDKKTEKEGEEDDKEVKLYVGNLPDQCRRASLKELFEKYGKVSQCDIVKNFAFVVSFSDIFLMLRKKSNHQLVSILAKHLSGFGIEDRCEFPSPFIGSILRCK